MITTSQPVLKSTGKRRKMTTIITLYGLPGSGKTTLSRQLYQELGGDQNCYLREEPISGLDYMEDVGRAIQTRLVGLDNRPLGRDPQFIIRDTDIYTSVALYGYSLAKQPQVLPKPADILIFVNTPQHILAEQIAKRGRPTHLGEDRYTTSDWQSKAYSVADSYPRRGITPIYVYNGCYRFSPQDIANRILKSRTKWLDLKRKLETYV